MRNKFSPINRFNIPKLIFAVRDDGKQLTNKQITNGENVKKLN